MMTGAVILNNFNEGMRGLVRNAGINAKVVVKKETEELIKTLVRISPAADPKRVRHEIMRKFELQSTPHPALEAKKSGSGVNWYNANRDFLFGVTHELDQRNASVSELKELLYKFTKRGYIRKDFKIPRRHQKVLIVQRILTKEATVKKLANHKAQNVGRLKAGWLAPVMRGALQLTGGNRPPKWATRHMNHGLRGDFVNLLARPGKPEFTVSNFSKGVIHPRMRWFVKKAMEIRAAAMVQNALLYMKGKKNIANYAR